MKDLRISHISCSLLIDDFSRINYTIINNYNENENSSNSILYLKISNDGNANKTVKINRENHFGSILANNGFVPIIECENGIIININLFNSNNKIFKRYYS